MSDAIPLVVTMADSFFDVYMKAIPGSKLDNVTGLLEIPPSSVSQMQPLHFVIGDRVFTLDVAAQLFPKYQDVALGGVAGKQYGTIGNMGNSSVPGLAFVLGQKFVERYYAVSSRWSANKRTSWIVLSRYSTRTINALDLPRRKSSPVSKRVVLSLPVHRNNTFTVYEG